MFSANINVSVPNDRTDELRKALDKLKKSEVLVGIPQEKSSRPDEGINNAELAFIQTNGIRRKSMREDMASDIQEHGYHKAYDMYIQTHGSPLWNAPPRPIIEPAIEDDKEKITEILGEAAKAMLDGDVDKAKEYLNKAGLEGQAASQQWFTNTKNGWAPNSPLTIAAKGSDKPLIDKGELRKAITYVIRERK